MAQYSSCCRLREAKAEHGAAVSLLEKTKGDTERRTATRLANRVEMHEAISTLIPELWILSDISNLRVARGDLLTLRRPSQLLTVRVKPAHRSTLRIGVRVVGIAPRNWLFFRPGCEQFRFSDERKYVELTTSLLLLLFQF